MSLHFAATWRPVTRVVSYGALGDTLLVAKCPDTTPAIRGYLQEAEKSTTGHAKQTCVGLTRIMGTPNTYLWEGIVQGMPDLWNPDLLATMDAFGIAAIFDDHATRSGRQLWIVEMFNDRLLTLN